MLENRVFKLMLLLSISIHGAVLFQSHNFRLLKKPDKDKPPEVTFVKPKPKKTEPEPEKHRMEPFLKLPKKISLDKRIPPPFIEKANVFKKDEVLSRKKISVTKPVLIDTDIISIKKKITLPPLKLDKINSPIYMGYYRLVREKIKHAAYRNYALNETGDTYVSFIISNSGALEDAIIIEEKTNASDVLRAIALKSIKDASPFPAFPKELDYPDLSFNVIISFEIE